MENIYFYIKNKNEFIKDLFHYFAVGAIAAFTEWTVFFALFSYHFSYLISATIAFLLATGVNYYFSRLVFKTGKFSNNTELTLIYLFSGIGLLLNLIIMWLLYDCLGIFSLLAKITATGIVFFWNFLSRKYFIFAH